MDMDDQPNDTKTDIRQEFGDAFHNYEKSLRTWFIAYGIGAPILLLTQSGLRDKFLASPDRLCIGILFLAGIVIQVFESWLYKMTTWYQYRGEVNKDLKKTRRYRFSVWVENRYWIDVVFDLATAILFVLATYKVFSIILGSPTMPVY